MKKQLFAAALVVAAISFTGCKPTGGEGGDGKITGISVSPKEIKMNENVTSAKLAAKLTPSDAKATVEWSSSDTTVATVTQKGFVEAVFYGECYIYAKVGDLKDSCKVTVTTYYESLIFTGACLAKVDTTYALDTITGKYRVDTVTSSSSGKTYLCYPSMATLELFSDGFYVNNSGYLDGAASGTIIEVKAPMYYGTQYLNGAGNGILFSLGKWAVTDTAKYAHQGLPGSIDEDAYIEGMKAFIDGFNAKDQTAYVNGLKAAGEAFQAPYIDTYTYDSSDPDNAGYTHPYVPNGICTEALIYVDNNYPASEYMYNLVYSNVTFELLAMDTVFGDYFGLNLAYNVDTKEVSLVDEEVYYEDPITVTYGQLPEEAKAMKPIMNPFILSEHPEIEARVMSGIKEKAVVLRKK